jgi:hypothetical protein
VNQSAKATHFLTVLLPKCPINGRKIGQMAIQLVEKPDFPGDFQRPYLTMWENL